MTTQPLVIDGNNLVKRCIMASALDDLKTEGTCTGGLYGTLTMLTSHLSNWTRDRGMTVGPIYVFFDNGVPLFRMNLLPYYKSGRKEKKQMMTEEQKERVMLQLDASWELFEKCGCVVGSYKDREADDVVAAAVQVLASCGYTPIVASSDRDLLQTVAMGAAVWKLDDGDLITASNFEDKVGVPMTHYLLYKTLMGDNSDSIPGARGVAEKIALDLVLEVRARHARLIDPYLQLKDVISFIASKEKHKKYEDGIIADEARLFNEMKGISLAVSFGATTGLEDKLCQTGAFDVMTFLRWAKSWKFNSVLGTPDRFTKPLALAASHWKEIAG